MSMARDAAGRLVHLDGDRIISYEAHKSDYALSHNMILRMRSRVRQAHKNIIHPRWLVDCDKQQRVVELNEGYYTH